MIHMPYKRIANNPHEDLEIFEEFPNCVTVEYTPPRKEIDSSSLTDDERKYARSFKHKLMMINGQENFVSISPISTFPDRGDFLHPKYDQVESIIIEGFDFHTPENIEELLDILQELPSGFVKGYEYGLGLNKNLRFIIHAIEQIPEVTMVVISLNKETNVEEDVYTLNYGDFEAIRKGINRIASAHQKESMIEKILFSQNYLLHHLLPEIYEEKKKPYQKNIIHKFVSSTSIESSSLSQSDAESIVTLLSDNKKSIYKKEKEKIVQLQQDIELLNLEGLIKETERLLSKKTPESKWQDFLNDNPLILSLVFGYPVIKILDQAFVGGRKLTGSGDKITDFLLKNNLTNNTALVEIKTAHTPLLGRKYRGSVYSPHTELTGSVTQVLDQKYKFQKEISTFKDNSGIYDIETYSVDCVLIIGTIPAEKEKKKSFELYRCNMRDVRIFTFDELLNKLKNIYVALKPEPLE